MNSPPPRHTWREFLGIRFDHHVAVQERTDCDYTIRILRLIVPPLKNSSVNPIRIPLSSNAFWSLFTLTWNVKAVWDDLLPIDLDSRLYTFQCSLRNLNLVDEPIVHAAPRSVAGCRLHGCRVLD